MEYNKLDQEYYVMSMDGANNHPLLAWGETDFSPFLEAELIEDETYELPLKIIFDEPYPATYEMVDLHMLASCSAVSRRFKQMCENLNIYGVQFIPIEIKSNKGETIKEYYAAHFWNKLSAIDKENYIGGSINNFGTIRNLSKFSLDSKMLNNIPLENRLIFGLTEKKTLILIHQSIYEAIQSAGLTGMKFFRVDDWDDNAMFR